MIVTLTMSGDQHNSSFLFDICEHSTTVLLAAYLCQQVHPAVVFCAWLSLTPFLRIVFTAKISFPPVSSAALFSSRILR